MTKLTIEFSGSSPEEEEEVRRKFMSWLSDSGEQDYWEETSYTKDPRVEEFEYRHHLGEIVAKISTSD